MKKKEKTAWEKVLIARNSNRPKAEDYIKNIFKDFIELHGDRLFGDDKSIIGGIAKLNDIPVTVIGVTDKIIMFENSVYSILFPEGFASILYKDSSKSAEAADKMKITAKELKKIGIIDEVVKEPENGTQEDFENVCQNLKNILLKRMKELSKKSQEDIVSQRYEKYRKIGGIL